MEQKRYEELKFTDDFMFSKVLENDPELCKDIIELIIEQHVEDIEFLTKQKDIKVRSDGKGVRLDIYVEGSTAVYDIEMQTVIKKELPKRTRYYQSMIDSNIIEQGKPYSDLRKSFIIFICLEDPFNKNRASYTFENRCIEYLEMKLGDESVKIFLNANGNTEGLSDGKKAFLNYIAGKKPTDNLTSRIDGKVTKAIEREEWKEEYMKYMLHDQDKIEEGYDMGVAAGKAEGLAEGKTETLIALVKDGLLDIKEAAKRANMPVDQLKALL